MYQVSRASLRAGSPLRHMREWRREKLSGGKESGEGVLTEKVTSVSRLAASPLDFAREPNVSLFAGYQNSSDGNISSIH